MTKKTKTSAQHSKTISYCNPRFSNVLAKVKQILIQQFNVKDTSL